jgi:hypothetical protein
MMSPEEARQRLHELIDMIPDEQISLVWMAFQGMIVTTDEEEDESEDDGDILDIDRV